MVRLVEKMKIKVKQTKSNSKTPNVALANI